MAKKSKKLGSKGKLAIKELTEKEKLAIKELTEAGLLEPLVRSMINTTNTVAPKNPTLPHQYPWLDYVDYEEIEDEGIEDEGIEYGKYDGEWKNGVFHGIGTFTFLDGRKYVGKWKNGKQHGQGTQTWSNGNKYVGEFKDGKQNGRGTL